jgi:hypothetical protein
MENPNSIKSLWELSNMIEVVSYKLSSIRDVAEIIAERVCSDPESGAIWAVAEMIEMQENQLEKISQELLNLHRETLKPKAQPKAPAKKGKKK